MTRKDFILIAEVLRRSQPSKDNHAPRAAWEVIVESFTQRLGREVPTFDAARFKKACGYGE